MSKTPEEKPVVKENLTSEERAREYANSVLPYANDIDAGYEQWIAWDNARLGYLSALKYSEKELTAYREALKEIVEVIRQRVFAGHLSDCLKYADTVLARTKQLLNENK